MELLQGIDAKAAAARPLAAAHSIWELVLHIAAWEKVAIRRIHGEALTLTGEQNFVHVSEASEETWQAAFQDLRNTHSDLIKAVSALPDSLLSQPVPGKDYDVRFMLLGTIQHAAYHGGQIALLKKL